MRVVINAIPLLSEPSGVPNYIYNISRQLLCLGHDDYTFYYRYFSKKLHYAFSENNQSALDSKIIYIRQALRRIYVSVGRIMLSRLLKDKLQSCTIARASSNRYDLYFEPNFIPIDLPAKRIVTTVHDLSFCRYPQFHPDLRIKYFIENFSKNILRSDAIITVSDYVKNELSAIFEKYGIPITRIYNGFDRSIYAKYDIDAVARYRRSKGLPADFILFVGSLEPRKNILGLFQAYIELPEHIKSELKIVLVGSSGWKNEEVLNWITKLQGSVTVLGKLGVAELAWVYNAARLLVYPSIYEGFGLPPLEAMACGCPVVVSNTASLPEVCGNAAHYVDPHDIPGIAEGILRAATDEDYRHKLIQLGLQQAKLFSWEQAAKEHWEVFSQVNCSITQSRAPIIANQATQQAS
jgi:glycosyltransferase involved in cell wall biosynthesis